MGQDSGQLGGEASIKVQRCEMYDRKEDDGV